MKYIYHYSSINKLALILESQKIRFNRLDYVNDPYEGESSDFESMASYLFVTCWSKNKDENFALWNMYTEKMRGVRIELPLPLFNSYNIGNNSGYIISENDYINKEEEFFIVSADNTPIEIKYTNDENKLFPKIVTEIGLKTSSLGIVKKRIWSMEEEVRFKMEIFPFKPTTSTINYIDYEELIRNKILPSINYYDVKINKESFKSMKIMTGPKMEAGDKQIIEALINKYNPTAKLIESALNGYIK